MPTFDARANPQSSWNLPSGTIQKIIGSEAIPDCTRLEAAKVAPRSAGAPKASYVAVEDALDAMVEDSLAFKDGSYDPAVYLLKGGSSE